jgi:type IV pilus assembly protein PilW
MLAAMKLPLRQRGETLIGLLVGLSLGLVVLTAGSQMLAQLVRGHRTALQDSHVQQDLHFAIDLMERELQDAQYVAGAWATRSPTVCTDPFCDGNEDFGLGDARLHWSLDRNHNGVQDNDECTGLRVRSGALQVRTACTPEVWSALTDTASLQVTRLQASLQCRLVAGWWRRHVQLQIEASIPGADGRSIAVARTVHLRNPLPQGTPVRYCP